MTALKAAVPGIETEAHASRPEWIPDILRHTGIGYHLAQHQHEHEGNTAIWAGDSPDIIQRP